MSRALPGYLLETEVGSGTFGTVWAGRSARTGGRVAVKVFDRAAAAPGEVRRQLHAEVGALVAVRSPHCLQVLDVIDTPQALAMVTDYVEGVSLKDLLAARGALSGPAVAQTIWGAAQGLAAVHSAGLIHGDVKPTNVLVDAAGASRLIDFGLADVPGWLRGDEPSEYGSPAYVSPEQITHGYREARSDLYSLAVTLFELLCRRRPYNGRTMQEVLWQHVHSPIPDPRAFAPDLRPELAQVVMWGLAKDPTQRPADVPSFLSAFETAATAQYGDGWLRDGALAATVGAVLATGTVASGALLATLGTSGALGGGAAAGAGVTGGGAAASSGATVAATGKAGLLATGVGKAAVAVGVVVAVGAAGVVAVKATQDSPSPHRAAISNGKIFYVRTGDDTSNGGDRFYSDIWSMNPDGSDKTRLTHGEENDSPVASPDGTKVAFVRWCQGQARNIFVMDADGSNQRRLTPDACAGVDRGAGDYGGGAHPAWSPDGTQIAFDSLFDQGSNLYVMNADGTGRRRLTRDWAASPVWSPGGKQIAFDTATGPIGNGVTNVDVIDPDGRGRHSLTHNATAGRSLGVRAWSAYGNAVVYVRLEEQSSVGTVFRLAATGRNTPRRVVSAGNLADVAVSPDGKTLVYATSTHDPNSVGQHYVLRRIGVDGTGSKQLLAAELDSPPTAAWSPDGSRLALGLDPSQNSGDIRLLSADGTRRQQLTLDGDAYLVENAYYGARTGGTWAVTPRGSNVAPSPPVDPNLTDAKLLNSTVPAGVCGDGRVGWKQQVPIRLHGGQGEAYDSAGKFAGAAVYSSYVVGYFGVGGKTAGLLAVECIGGTIAQCCAGRASHATYLYAVTADSGGRLTMLGDVLRAGASGPGDQYGPAQRDISAAIVDAAGAVTTSEYIYYPEQYTADQVGGDPTKNVLVIHHLVDGRWTTGQGAAPKGAVTEQDARTAAEAVLTQLENGTDASTCSGDTTGLHLRDFTIGEVTPATTGRFQVSAEVTLDNGSIVTVSVIIGSDSSTGSACVESDSVPTSASVTQASPPADVPSVPSAGEPVPTDAPLPSNPSGGAVIPYTEDGTTPTSPAQIVEYQPTGLTGPETAAVRDIIAFMAHINQQNFVAAWRDTAASGGSSRPPASFRTGFATARFYQVAFGQPERVNAHLIVIPSRWVSRQDPAAQGNPPGVTDCSYWPQFTWAVVYRNGKWLWGNDAAAANLRALDQFRRGGSLNPVKQRVAC